MSGSRPGGEMATRPLHFIWIVDCSGSMSVDGKIQSLNTAIRDAIPSMRSVADENPFAEVLIRAVKFSSGAQWHVSQPTEVASFTWTDVQAQGVTDLGRALTMVADQLKIPPMSERALPPVLVLISDGQPTDDYSSGIKAIMDQPWGKKAVRLAIAIGGDADVEVLQKFIGNPEIAPLVAMNSDDLVNYIRWASTNVLQAASSPASQTKDVGATPTSNVPIPVAPVPVGAPSSSSDVW